MKIVVTGGAGFIGSAFIRYMLNKYDYKIVNLDALTYAGHLENLESIKNHPDYEFVKGNILDKNLVSDVLNGADAVINFAAESHVDNSITSPDIFIDTNIKGTINLLDAVKKCKIRRFIQISTDEVYGELPQSGYFKETSPINPNSPYSASKASADINALAYFRTYNLPVIVTRCSNNYGPYQHPEKLIPYFISRLLDGKKVTLYGDGLNVRDWIHVDDHIRAIDAVFHKGKDGEVYNIGANNEKTNLEITKIILDIFGYGTEKIDFIKDRPGHDRRYAIDSSKIKKELGFESIVNFDEGIKSTVEWYINNKAWIEAVSAKEAVI